jgi:hypothetical protein
MNVLLVNSDSTRLNDPKSARRSLGRKGMNQSSNENLYCEKEVVGTSQNHQARSRFGRVPENIRRIQIKGYENTVLRDAVFVKILIDCSVKTLLSNG